MISEEVEVRADDPFVLEGEHLLQRATFTLLRTEDRRTGTLRWDEGADRVVVLLAEREATSGATDRISCSVVRQKVDASRSHDDHAASV